MANSHVNIPVATSVFLALVDFLRTEGSDRDPVQAVTNAIEYWIENASWKQTDLLPEVFDQPKHMGYWWKHFLMPPGTKIRMKYKGETYHASVEGDAFVYDGKKMTPSAFANKVAGGARNAWRDLLIQRPGDSAFRLAEVLRTQYQDDLTDLALDLDDSSERQ